MTSPTYTAPAASKLLDILELLAAQDTEISLSEICRQLDISLNSTFRICRVLEERGYLLRDANSGLLSLTSKLYALGMRLSDRLDVLRQARATLEWLTEQTGENAHLCVLREGQLVLLGQCVSPNPVRVVVETGTLLSPHASAFGKVILAHLPPAEQQAMLAIPWPRLTPYTQTNPAKMAAEWDEIRVRGVAFDLEEYQIGVRCIGAPVVGVNGVVIAGIGVMGPSYRLTPEQLAAYEPLVKEAAARVSATMCTETRPAIAR